MAFGVPLISNSFFVKISGDALCFYTISIAVYYPVSFPEIIIFQNQVGKKKEMQNNITGHL